MVHTADVAAVAMAWLLTHTAVALPAQHELRTALRQCRVTRDAARDAVEAAVAGLREDVSSLKEDTSATLQQQLVRS